MWRFFIKKTFLFIFVFIYTILFAYVLIRAPDIYNAVWFVYYLSIPSSVLYVSIDAYFSLPTHGNVYFDVAVMYLLGVIQYGIVGWICQKVFQYGSFFMKRYFLHK